MIVGIVVVLVVMIDNDNDEIDVVDDDYDDVDGKDHLPDWSLVDVTHLIYYEVHCNYHQLMQQVPMVKVN